MERLADRFNVSPLVRQTGQGMSEYLIITALIAIAGIGVVGFLGDSINNQLASMSQEIAGNDGSAATGEAQTAAGNAETNASTGKTLANFATANGGGAGGGD